MTTRSMTRLTETIDMKCVICTQPHVSGAFVILKLKPSFLIRDMTAMNKNYLQQDSNADTAIQQDSNAR